MSNRTEHLEWCKKRAIQYAEMGDVNQAFSSFTSDMRKDEITANHAGLPLMMALFFNGDISTPAEMRKFIEGFN